MKSVNIDSDKNVRICSFKDYRKLAIALFVKSGIRVAIAMGVTRLNARTKEKAKMYPEKTRRSYGRCECNENNKPPVGLRPRFIVAEERMQEIMEAMVRYSEAKMAIPTEWLEEYNELSEYLRNR